MDQQFAPANYRGRRRVPKPPRGRYAAVMMTALLSAGVVAWGAGAALPDHAAGVAASDAWASVDLTNRLLAEDRAARGDGRTTARQKAPDVWQLPVQSYHVTSLFGTRWGKLHAGVDMGAGEGTPIVAAAGGVVTLCRWDGGYGYAVNVTHGGGILTVYGHASKLLCQEGQRVQAGDVIAKVGNTGHSFGAHLHYEIRVSGHPIEPTSFMKKHGVDIIKHAQAVDGDIISD